MRQVILIFFVIPFFSCKNSFHSPGDKEIREAVKAMYEKRNEANGGGGWTINEVNVLKSSPGDDKRHFNAEVSVKGVHTSAPLAVKAPDEPIDEARQVKLIWRNGKWIIADE